MKAGSRITTRPATKTRRPRLGAVYVKLKACVMSAGHLAPILAVPKPDGHPQKRPVVSGAPPMASSCHKRLFRPTAATDGCRHLLCEYGLLGAIRRGGYCQSVLNFDSRSAFNISLRCTDWHVSSRGQQRVEAALRRNGEFGGCRSARITASPVRVLGENVIAALRQCVAREPALRVVALRRGGRLGGGAERIGRCVVVE
jgi:hypothetical protein